MSFAVAVVILAGAALLAAGIVGGAAILVRRLGPAAAPGAPAEHSGAAPAGPDRRADLARVE